MEDMEIVFGSDIINDRFYSEIRKKIPLIPLVDIEIINKIFVLGILLGKEDYRVDALDFLLLLEESISSLK